MARGQPYLHHPHAGIDEAGIVVEGAEVGPGKGEERVEFVGHGHQFRPRDRRPGEKTKVLDSILHHNIKL
jgi:hypothetical protein